jgi:hypothetical protein
MLAVREQPFPIVVVGWFDERICRKVAVCSIEDELSVVAKLVLVLEEVPVGEQD